MSHVLPDQFHNGPHIAGYSIYHNDRLHLLQINGRLVKLSPTEYKLSMLLLRHFERLQQFALLRQEKPDMEVPNVYVSFEELRQSANLAERLHVTKHLSNVNGKLRVHGITIICVGDCGYTLGFQQGSWS